MIGVVGDAMTLRVHTRGAAAIYRPGVWPDWAKLTVRTADPTTMSPLIRDAVRAVSPDLQPSVQVVADAFEVLERAVFHPEFFAEFRHLFVGGEVFLGDGDHKTINVGHD